MKKSAKPKSTIERLNAAKGKRIRDLTPAERDAFHAKMAAMVREITDAVPNALKAACLPENFASAMRIVLDDPETTLEDDQAFGEIPIDNAVRLITTWADKERARAKLAEQGRANSKSPYSRTRTPKRWRTILTKLEGRKSPMPHSTFINRTTKGKRGFLYHRSPDSTSKMVSLRLADLSSSYDDDQI